MPYNITAQYAQQLRTRMADFAAQTNTRKGLLTTLVTTYGVLPDKNAGIVQTQVVMDDLFAPPARR